jgi:Leucine-rich repeat (LRR) protein
MLEYLPMTVKEIDLSSNSITRLTERVVGGSNDNDEHTTTADADADADADEQEFAPSIVLPNLVSLDVSKNKLTKLPSSAEVPSLQTLRFGHNNIASLPLDLIVVCSRALSTLEGQDNQLRSVPDLFVCKRLQNLDLSDNLLSGVPSVNASLVRLSLNNNSIVSLGGLFSGAQLDCDAFRSDLTELRLRGNKLSELEEDIVRCLTKMALLDVGQNDLRD